MKPGRHQHAFSLLELLMVIILIIFLLALAVGGYGAMTQAAALTTGADLIRDALDEARQNAMTQNTTVEVRLYAANSGNGLPYPIAYNVLQLHWLKSDKTTPPAGHLLSLPVSVVIDGTPEHSPLVATDSLKPTPDPADTRLNEHTRAFRFLPDGTTDLDPGGKWFLTLRAASQANPARFPSNWACVEVDPATGRAQIYRP